MRVDVVFVTELGEDTSVVNSGDCKAVGNQTLVGLLLEGVKLLKKFCCFYVTTDSLL